MACAYSQVHRVEFADTDAAGIMHFAGYFRAMEATEHAFFRSLGLSILTRLDGVEFGWPRVRAECDYKSPLRFEDEFEVRLTVREKRTRSICYDFDFLRPTGEHIATGSITVVCVSTDPATGTMKAVPIPDPISRAIVAREQP
jgi:YbgC/YbaW family acyl-CoA thioester hydrolase